MAGARRLLDCSYQKRSFFSCKLKWSESVKKSFMEAFSVNFHDLLSSLQNLSFNPNETLNIFTSFLLKLLPSHSNSKSLNKGKNKNNSINKNNLHKTSPISSHPSSSPSNPPTHSSPKPSVPWWNEDCEKALSERKLALLLYKAFPSVSNFIELKRQEAITKRTLKKAKRIGWHSFCTFLSHITSHSSVLLVHD